jgi:hypothetical protein
MLGMGVKEPNSIKKEVFPDKQGKMHYKEKPMFYPGWKITFNLICTDDSLNPKKLKECLELAGLLYGVGSGRPDNGRFDVKEFKPF